jgi:hypothetical protein
MKKYIILGAVMFFIVLLAVYMSLRGISYHEWGQELKEEAGVRKSLGYPENQGSNDKPVEGRDVIGNVNVQKHDDRTEEQRSEDAQSLSPASRLKEQPHI